MGFRRYGSINYQVNVSDAGFTTALEWNLHGRGYVVDEEETGAASKLRVIVRLRDHRGSSRSARNPKVVSGDCVVVGHGPNNRDATPAAFEAVAVTLSGTSQGAAGTGKCTIAASLAE